MKGLSTSNYYGVSQSKENQSTNSFHVEVVDGANYEVTSNYIGDVSILDVFKQMLKRDIEQIKP